MEPIKTVFKAIADAIPDSTVTINGYNNDVNHYNPKGREGNHLNVEVWSPAFSGKSLLDQHRMIHESVKNLMQMNGGFIHALIIKTHDSTRSDEDGLPGKD